MLRPQQPAVSLFAAGLIAIGLLSVISRDFAYGLQPVPPFHPGREALAVACGLITMAVGLGLVFRRTAAAAVRALLVLLIAWLCLQLPVVVTAPGTEVSWLTFGQLAMLLAGGWTLFACLSGLEGSRFFGRCTGDRGLRGAQILFGLGLLPVGLSHLAYPAITISLIPSFLPFHPAFAYLTGLGQMACGIGVLFWIWPRAAALIESAMLVLFAVFVWGPNTWFSGIPVMAGTPTGYRYPLTDFLFTLLLAAAALLIATNLKSNQSPWRRFSGRSGSVAAAGTPGGGAGMTPPERKAQ